MPSSLDQARRFMKKLDRWERVSSERFDALLEGAWHPRAGRSFSPFLFDRMARLLGLRSSEDQWHIRPIEDAHYALMQDIERAARQANLPLLVVYIPSIEEVRGGTNPVGDPEEVRDFAKRIGASFLDGTAAFEKLDNDVLEACCLAVDEHFSQTGMRHFGAYMGPALVEWIHGDHAPTASPVSSSTGSARSVMWSRLAAAPQGLSEPLLPPLDDGPPRMLREFPLLRRRNSGGGSRRFSMTTSCTLDRITGSGTLGLAC